MQGQTRLMETRTRTSHFIWLRWPTVLTSCACSWPRAPRGKARSPSRLLTPRVTPRYTMPLVRDMSVRAPPSAHSIRPHTLQLEARTDGCAAGLAEACRYLVCECKASLESRNRDGLTPLMCAVQQGHAPIVQALVDVSPRNVHETNNCGAARSAAAGEGESSEAEGGAERWLGRQGTRRCITRRSHGTDSRCSASFYARGPTPCTPTPRAAPLCKRPGSPAHPSPPPRVALPALRLRVNPE
jgi:hypothetical protein